VNIMRSLVVRETALNLYFMDGHSYQYVARVLDVTLYAVKSWVALFNHFTAIFAHAPKARRAQFDI